MTTPFDTTHYRFRYSTANARMHEIPAVTIITDVATLCTEIERPREAEPVTIEVPAATTAERHVRQMCFDLMLLVNALNQGRDPQLALQAQTALIALAGLETEIASEAAWPPVPDPDGGLIWAEESVRESSGD